MEEGIKLRLERLSEEYFNFDKDSIKDYRVSFDSKIIFILGNDIVDAKVWDLSMSSFTNLKLQRFHRDW